MKMLKKSISLILCIITIFSCFALSASAQSSSERLPQVYVAGFESRRIYLKDDPNKTMLFPVNFDLLMENLKRFEEYTTEAVENKEYKLVYNYLYSAFYDTLGLYALKGDGMTGVNENVVCEAPGFSDEGRGFYYFTYDSRLSPIDIAAQLNDFIKRVQEHSGSEKVELVGASYGGTVVATYLNEYPEMHKYLDSVLLSVPSFGGFSAIGELFSGDFYVDHDTLTQYAYVGMNNEDIGLLLSVLNKSGLLKLILEWMLLPAFKVVAMDAARDVFHDTIATNPSIWTFVPDEYFESAMKNMYGRNYADPDQEYAGVISKAIYFNENIQKRLDEIYLEAQADGIKMNIICKYGRPPMPLSEKGSFMSDGSVDIRDVTMGATTSEYGKTLPFYYRQKKFREYNFMSPDRCIDASTGVDPMHTWYIRGVDHRDQSLGYNKLIEYIIYEDPDVFSGSEFPQFTYALPDGNIAPITGKQKVERTTLIRDCINLTKRVVEIVSDMVKEKIGK